jgi:hypothetical protein
MQTKAGRAVVQLENNTARSQTAKSEGEMCVVLCVCTPELLLSQRAAFSLLRFLVEFLTAFLSYSGAFPNDLCYGTSRILSGKPQK